jgi:hypothetical protein
MGLGCFEIRKTRRIRLATWLNTEHGGQLTAVSRIGVSGRS